VLVKIKKMTIETDEGERTISLTNYVEVDPTAAEAPDNFCQMAIMMWECVRRAATGQLTVEKGPPS
jgi:hypothetical protein